MAEARRVVESDPEVDRLEVELEEDCLKVLALHQPAAKDLRFIVAQPDQIESYINLLSVSRCFERVADQATKFAEDVIYMIEGNIIPGAECTHSRCLASRIELAKSFDS